MGYTEGEAGKAAHRLQCAKLRVLLGNVHIDIGHFWLQHIPLVLVTAAGARCSALAGTQGIF